jgi:ankyrin repeat protein
MMKVHSLKTDSEQTNKETALALLMPAESHRKQTELKAICNLCSTTAPRLNRDMSLLGLPNELLLEITSKHLYKEREIYSFMRTNRRLYSLARQELYRYNAAYDNSSALHVAAETGNLETVVYAHEYGGAVLEAAHSRYDAATPLHLASRAGHVAIVDFLLAQNVAVNTRAGLDRTALSEAVQHGHFAIVERLLAVDGIDPGIADSFRRSPLWWACRRGHLKIVQALLCREDVDVNSGCDDNETPLFVAAFWNHVDVVKILLADDRVDPNLVAGFTETTLMMACAKGYEQVVRALLASPKTEIQPDIYGRHALFHAVEGNHTGIVDMLLDHGAPIDAPEHSGQTALFMAARNGLAKMAYHLITRGADPSPASARGYTPLCWAAHANSASIIKILLEDPRVDANRVTPSGSRPIHIAAVNACEALEHFLQRDDVDVNCQDRIGRTPLMLAVWRARMCHIELLLANEKIDVNVQSKDGCTALVYAAKQGRTGVVKALLGHPKIDVNVADGEGRTALYWAREEGDGQIAELLVAAGARERS